MRSFCVQQPVFRLRVVANSDDETDQMTKLRVRDAVLPTALQIPFHLRAVARAAREIDPTARVRRGALRFCGRSSAAVQVTLGAGKGHNWWGILYPTAVGLPAVEAGEGAVHFESWFITLFRRWGWI